MHSATVRVQNVSSILTTVVTVLACLIAATDFLSVRNPSASVSPTSLQVNHGRPHYYSRKKEEYAVVRFNLEADLSSLFTWNTKEVFVYVTAEWDGASTDASKNTNATEPTNTAVIWDLMITSPSSDYLSNIGPIAKRKLLKSGEGKSIDPSRGLLRLKNQKPKYQITHPSGKIAETTNMRLRVNYNVQPWVGMLAWAPYTGDGFLSYIFPTRGGAGSPLWKPMDGAISETFDLPAVASSKSTTKSRKSRTKTRTKSSTESSTESSAESTAESTT